MFDSRFAFYLLFYLCSMTIEPFCIKLKQTAGVFLCFTVLLEI